ncbi:electron transport protein [Halalkalibacter urbisdiaboli]|uniref:electron transport protein n=1 Tax=Halalkalibacter urbisdiaboli TaxID=1960589 RepID=UPI000B441FAE|nr:electron transport protein [Halalkalibacter urbisdiaboli]
MRRLWVWIVIVGIVIVLYNSINALEPKYAVHPSAENTLNHPLYHKMNETYGYDIFGLTIDEKDANELLKTEEGQSFLSLQNGAVKIDEQTIEEGRALFYEETFNNEEFITDVVGVLDGPLSLFNIAKAVLKVRGEGTDNLKVELAEDALVGGRQFKKGEVIETGLDVPKGAFAPLGMPITIKDGRIKAGITCAACHASVDRDTGKVIEGAPNANLNGGLLLALATNSVGFLSNSDVDPKVLQTYLHKQEWVQEKSLQRTLTLPDAETLEAKVDEAFLKWPKGNFDSTNDFENNPSQIPDAFTLGDHPYGWSGHAAVGPFKGLSAFNNNVHAQNTDLLAQTAQSDSLFGIDKDLYAGTILQNAPSSKYRYDPESGQSPSEFLASRNNNKRILGLNDSYAPPTFPNLSLFAPNGTVIGTDGSYVLEELNEISAYQNTLVPPSKLDSYNSIEATGREVFEKAGCIRCHAGHARTNNKVIAVEEIQTETSRAKAFKDTKKLMEEPWIYQLDTPIPIPENAEIVKMPIENLDREQLKLSFAYDTNGGYKVKGLVGLKYSAPYLHDGGVAVGRDIETELGLPGTLNNGIHPDPYNSLKALVDKQLRKKVIAANRGTQRLQDAHVSGEGHEFWVDKSTGFSKEEQDALIQYLLSIDLEKERKAQKD